MTDFYVRKSQNLKDYESDTNIIVDRRYLKFFKDGKYLEDEDEIPIAPEWYPRCNSYYGYTEDVDALNRVHHLLSAKKYLASFTKLETEIPTTDPYDEDEAQIEFLKSKPATFLILGKPGIGEQRLGQLLAEYWKCVYIDPEILVKEEIQSGSRAGKCIEFNLRCGRAVAIDVILHLLAKRVRSKTAQHRGFVICGFPLLRNDMYQDDPVSSESAVFTAQEIFEEIIEPLRSSEDIRHVSEISEGSTTSYSKAEIEQSGEGFDNPEEEAPVEEAEEKREVVPSVLVPGFPIDIGSATSNIFKVTDLGTDYSEQLMFVFSLCHNPLIILYITCQNTDVLIRHENYRYNLKTDEVVDLLRNQNENVIYTIFTKNRGFDNEELPDNLLEDFGEPAIRLNTSEMNYLLYLPSDFSGNIATQLMHYHYEALPTIEKRVLLLDPQYFIKLDGRVSPHKMFNIVKSKLRVLPIPRVIIPEKILDEFVTAPGEGGFDFDPYAIFEEKTPEECFENLRERKIINRMFKWKWSKWGAFCPVAMKNGIYIKGKPTLAVKFTNRLFFLSDEEAIRLFLRNPRIYLLPPAPRHSCKIIITGPKASGKTAVAHCLAIYLSGIVLDPIYLHQEFFKRKRKQYVEKVRNEAINVAVTLLEEARVREYENLEAERKQKLEKLLEEKLKLIKKRVSLTDLMTLESHTSQLTAFPLRSIRKLEIDPETMLKHKEEYDSLKQSFEHHGLPFFSDVDLCASYAKNPDELSSYLPDELKEPTPPLPPVDIFDDFVTKYADAEVDKIDYDKIDMSIEDMLEMYATAVKEIEEKNAEKGEHHGGWIIDGMPPNAELLTLFAEKCKPDDIFVFREFERGFLLNRFKIKGQNEFKDYRNFFQQLGKPEIALKAPSSISTMSYKVRLASDVIDDMLANERIVGDDLGGEEEDEDNDEFVDVDYFAFHSTRLALKEYDKELDLFEREYQDLVNEFEENDIAFEEIDVANKTLPELMTVVLKYINNKFRLTAHEFTPEERFREVEDFGEPQIPGEDVEEEEDEKQKIEGDIDTFSENRRLGNTNYYCPVTFHDQWVLWRGKDENAAKFDDKLYFMRSEEALHNFITNPIEYLSCKPPTSFPPPRICIAGVAGSGKTTLAKYLSKALGLYYASYENLLKNIFDSTYGLDLTSLRNQFKEYPAAISLEEYLLSDQPLPDELMDKINLRKLWFDEPVRSGGFVLDDYPKRPCDVDYIRENMLIPDIILELSGSSIELNNRHVQLLISEWAETMNKKQDEQDKLNRQIADEWEKERELKIAELLELKKQERFQEKMKERSIPTDSQGEDGEKTDDSPLTNRSQISYDSVAKEADLDEVLKQVALELPQPMFEDNWETLEEATERIINQTEIAYISDNNFFRLLKERCEEELIDWVSINADFTLERIRIEASMHIDKIKFRNESLFERCYSASVELAETLLEMGYCFLSRFARVCPVQVYEKENPSLMFYPLEQTFELYPVLHRSYVYFLAGKVNRDKFRANPLKYTSQMDFRFPIVPIKVAIIGPPKCGKTALAERFKKELGLKYVSIGQAARHVLRFLPHSLLAKRMEIVLRNGWELTSEMTMSCVAAMAFDAKSITQGMVFDGFPNSITDIRHLEQIGLVPHLVIDLEATFEDIDMYLASDMGKRGLPVFSRKFIDHRYSEWSLFSTKFRTWLDREYQILAGLPMKKCRWGVWKSAYELTKSVLFEVKNYYKNCDNYMGLRLVNMQITPREFLERQSSFKGFCPCCLYYKNLLVSSDHPPERAGLVQFHKYFYWLCDDHIDEFINNPEAYLVPYNKNTLPQDLPVQGASTEKLQRCYEDGTCIVCFVDNQPERVLHEGRFSLACTYKDCTYLFDSYECLNKFQSNPFKYFNKIINFKPPTELAPLKFEELPVLGILEQYVADNIIKAVINTSMTRPILPGLSIAQSAAVSVGLHLKVNNPNTPEETITFFKKANRLFKERRLSLINSLAKMKRNINPHLHYEEPLLDLVLPTFTEEKLPLNKEPINKQKEKCDVVKSRRVPVPDERFDYLCEYFKPVSKVPAFLNIVDIAGLVKGASEGQGLGNAFLSHISACDAIFHLCRVFEDEDVTHVEGEVNPVRDLEIIGEELRLKDEEQLVKNLEKLERTVLRGGDKKMKPEYDTLAKIKGVLVDQKQHIRFADWNANDIEILNKYLFLTSKPMIYLVNLAEKDYIKKKNKWLIKIKEWVDKNDPGSIIIPFSGAFEQKLIEIEDPILRKKFSDDNGTTSALDKIIVQGYKALQLEYFFTSGADEVKAWTIQKGTKAPQAAGKIHTDFEKGFIMAEVMKFSDFKEEGTESAVKAAGKYRQQGRNYVVEDGDIIFFKFNAGAGLKDAKKK